MLRAMFLKDGLRLKNSIPPEASYGGKSILSPTN